MRVAFATVNLSGQECCGAGGRHGHLHQEGKAQENTDPGVSASMEGTEIFRQDPGTSS